MNPPVKFIFGMIIGGLLLTSAVAVLKYGRAEIVTPPANPPTLADLLQECLPKSDQKSHTRCRELMAQITDFESCVQAGIPFQESYPRRCTVPDGRTFTEIPRSPVPAGDQTLTGTYTCLPKKNTGGPVTLECALGLKTTQGDFYALSVGNLTEAEQSRLREGETLTVSGLVIPLEALSSDRWHTFAIAGIMEVKSLTP